MSPHRLVRRGGRGDRRTPEVGRGARRATLGPPVSLTVGPLAKPRISLNLDEEPPSNSLCRLAGSTQIRGVDLDRLESDPALQDLGYAFGLLAPTGCQV